MNNIDDSEGEGDTHESEIFEIPVLTNDRLANICRICMVSDVPLVHLWSPPTEKFEENFQFIRDIITRFTSSVQIDENDKLPVAICEKCESTVYFTYTFKRKCEKSEEILRQLANQNACEEEPATNKSNCAIVPEPSALPVDDGDDKMLPTVKNESDDQVLRLHRTDTPCEPPDQAPPKRFKCSECDQDFAQPQTLRRHRKIHLGAPTKCCSVCGKSFYRSDDLKRHVRIHTGEKPYSCTECQKSFKQSSELNEHRKTHSNTKSFECKVCGKLLATRNGYYVHLKIHRGVKNHACTMCDKKFTTNGELTSHISYIHVKQKPYGCTVADCTKKFVTRISLNKHIKHHDHGNGRKSEVYRHEKFNTMEGLGDDTEIHVRASSASLKKHMAMHDDGDGAGRRRNKFECEICHKTFALSSRLDKHLESHGEKGPFICDLCGAVLLEYSVFVQHRQLHNEEEEEEEIETTADEGG